MALLDADDRAAIEAQVDAFIGECAAADADALQQAAVAFEQRGASLDPEIKIVAQFMAAALRQRARSLRPEH
ncbi:hypothetical protein ACETK8_20160 (plasmid) [Brevundimonas staleyi]|uniref:Uncharacterized protein n=1 Tax=Brevundimonas staleyi TaxID=74326 RepID=A0ABW0FNG9_9CAUL